ncbi:MAG: ABC transporter permease [Thermoleophilia bacterium]|nr:ABC transporter permease [Thermoleophilia bacterium]
MRIIRNVFRRKLRASLTIFGITIGVFALVVMGAMAEKITLLVDGGTRYFSDKVTVSASSMHGFGAGPLSVNKLQELETIDDVALASADITMTLEKEQGASFGMPSLVIGSDLRGIERESFSVSFRDGRDLEAGDAGKAVVGSDLVRRMDAQVGNTITVRDREFEVVGIMEKTFTMPDNSIFIPFLDAQEIFYHDNLPEIVRTHIDMREITTGITLYPEEGVDPDELAERIKEMMPEYDIVGPARFEEQVTSATRIFTTIVFGVAIISLLVGGLSVINTMTMSVFERTREIGIRKSLGASHGRIIRQFLSESAVIGLIGGISGLLLGWLFIVVANSLGDASGTVVFLLTPRLAVGSVAFAFFLGILSGLYPSWRAARMNPVEALRYE